MDQKLIAPDKLIESFGLRVMTINGNSPWFGGVSLNQAFINLFLFS
jgi:hypothetical protein